MDEVPELRLLFHRLNNQLGIILAHAELLESKATDDDEPRPRGAGRIEHARSDGHRERDSARLRAPPSNRSSPQPNRNFTVKQLTARPVDFVMILTNLHDFSPHLGLPVPKRLTATNTPTTRMLTPTSDQVVWRGMEHGAGRLSTPIAIASNGRKQREQPRASTRRFHARPAYRRRRSRTPHRCRTAVRRSPGAAHGLLDAELDRHRRSRAGRRARSDRRREPLRRGSRDQVRDLRRAARSRRDDRRAAQGRLAARRPPPAPRARCGARGAAPRARVTSRRWPTWPRASAPTRSA